MNNEDPKLKKITWYSYARCSTPMQTNSTPAQMEQTERICKEFGWELSKRTFEDFGVSGREMKNFSEGNLGRFFDAIDNGLIETPCGLVIESLQRFSRSAGLDVLPKMRDYLRKGVYFHLSQDRKTFDYASFNKFENQLPLYIEAETNKAEVERKEKNQARGIEYRHNKTIRGEKTFYSRNSPSWINNKIVGQNADSSPIYEYEINEEKADIVRRIFQDRLAGLGTVQIANNLNKDRVPSLSNFDVPWNYGSVTNVLRSRAVCGMLVFYKVEKTEDKFGNIKRKKVVKKDQDGNPLEVKIYPEVISEEIYQQVRLESEKVTGKRFRKFGSKNANVFSGLCVCGYCKKGLNLDSNAELKSTNGKDFTMHHRNNGSQTIYRCSNQNCKNRIDKYYVENLVFKYLNEVNIDSLFGQTDNKELKKLEKNLINKQTELSKLLKNRDKIFNKYLEDESDEFFANKYSDIKDKIQTIQKDITSLETSVLTESASTKNLKKDWNRVLKLINNSEDENSNRMRLNKLLRDKISKIRLFGDGTPISTNEKGFDFDRNTYKMTNETFGNNTIAIRIEFKGNVDRTIVYNEKTESAFVTSAELDSKSADAQIKQATQFNFPSNPKNISNTRSRQLLKMYPKLKNKEVIADVKNDKLTALHISKKYNLPYKTIRKYRKRIKT